LSGLTNSFSHLKTSRKLALGFGLCLFFSAMITTLAILRMQQMNAVSQDLVSDSIPADIACGEMHFHAARFRELQYRYILDTSDQGRAKTLALQQEQQQQMADALNQYSSTFDSAQDHLNFNAVQTSWNQYVQENQELLQITPNQEIQKGTPRLIGPLRATYDQLLAQVDTMVDYNKKIGQQYSHRDDHAVLDLASALSRHR
jgi:hypothetical protein